MQYSRAASEMKRSLNMKKTAVHPTTLQLTQRAIASSPGKIIQSVNQHQSEEIQQYPQRNTQQEKTLDGFMLLECCRVEFPDEVTQAVLSGMNIKRVVTEDLLFFSNLARLDMSDNEAPLEPFGCLPALVELDFQCNAVQDLSLGGGFLNLEVLNLSFNCLVSKDVEELSNLLRIRELYLSNNWIRSLPPIMDRFSRLETLALERNNIAGDEIFSFLAIVPRLRNLNLSHNKLTRFPESALTLEDKRGTGFYNLLYLNLAHNRITEEASVIYICELHSLRKLVLYGNPLTHSAVVSSDPTTLAYDPVPLLTAQIAERVLPMVVVTAYPETKKKKRPTMSSYENVEIYKMIPNEVPLHRAFQTRTTAFMFGDTATKEESPKPERKEQGEQCAMPISKPLRIDTSDSTFLTGVGIEDFLDDSMTAIPAVPSSMITRSLAATKTVGHPMNTRAAINALRYQLAHPLTSHDDAEVLPPRSQKPTQAQMQRQRPRQSYASNASSAGSKAMAISSTHAGHALHNNNRGSRGIDDALTELSNQVTRTWEKRRSAEHQVDQALDSLMSTAHKFNLTYRSSPHSAVG